MDQYQCDASSSSSSSSATGGASGSTVCSLHGKARGIRNLMPIGMNEDGTTRYQCMPGDACITFRAQSTSDQPPLLSSNWSCPACATPNILSAQQCATCGCFAPPPMTNSNISASGLIPPPSSSQNSSSASGVMDGPALKRPRLGVPTVPTDPSSSNSFSSSLPPLLPSGMMGGAGGMPPPHIMGAGGMPPPHMMGAGGMLPPHMMGGAGGMLPPPPFYGGGWQPQGGGMVPPPTDPWAALGFMGGAYGLDPTAAWGGAGGAGAGMMMQALLGGVGGGIPMSENPNAMLCSRHHKMRHINNLEQIDGAWVCKDANACKVMDASSQARCTKHGSMRSIQMMDMQSDGSYVCKPEQLCRALPTR